MLEPNLFVAAAAWVGKHVTHPEHLLLLVAGVVALCSFWVASIIARAKRADASAHEEVPAGDDLI